MSNVYRFIYDSGKSNGYGVYPEASTIKARHYFEDDASWVPILWQFAKFLESTGHVGVIDRIIIKDKYGVFSDCNFETIGEIEETDCEDDLEDLDWEAAFPKDNQDKDAN